MQLGQMYLRLGAWYHDKSSIVLNLKMMMRDDVINSCSIWNLSSNNNQVHVELSFFFVFFYHIYIWFSPGYEFGPPNVTKLIVEMQFPQICADT